MATIAKRVPSTWFDRLTMTGHPEPVEGCRNVCANNYVVVYSLRPIAAHIDDGRKQRVKSVMDELLKEAC